MIVETLRDSFDDLPSSLQSAARFLIDNSSQVPLLSMREQSREAGVAPATMLRLARRLGFESYDELRQRFAEEVMGAQVNFSRRSEELFAKHREFGSEGIIGRFLESQRRSFEELSNPHLLHDLLQMARMLAACSKIYVIGIRSSYPVAWQFCYLCNYFTDRVEILDGAGQTGPERLYSAPENSAFLGITIFPYAALTLSLAKTAKAKGMKVATITDSLVSPIVQFADSSTVVPNNSPSFFDSSAMLTTVCEILVMLLAAETGEDITAKLKLREKFLIESGVLTPVLGDGARSSGRR